MSMSRTVAQFPLRSRVRRRSGDRSHLFFVHTGERLASEAGLEQNEMKVSATPLRRRSLWLARGQKVLSSLIVAAALSVSAAPVSSADDLAGLTRALVTGADFRLRVSAALSLGKTRSKAAVAPLANALDDAHPAVRAAAAAALGVLGDRTAVGTLRMHLGREASSSVKTQIETALTNLSGAGGGEKGARMLVKLGQMHVSNGVRNGQLLDIFRGATRARAAELPGVEVLSDTSEEGREAAQRRLPVLVLDGTLNRLAQGSQGANVTVSAQVEYVIRKSPEHALKGSVTGAAQALGNMSAQDQGRVAQLEMEALQGAVESAMKGAPAVMQQALH